MSWADRTVPASLGGVPFLALDSDVEVGRRVISIELPNKDEPEYEDMGRKPRRYSLTAVLIGEDYDRARQELVDVIEAPGPHLLEHTWWPPIMVIVTEAGRFTETVEKGGMVSVSLSLTEAGKDTRVTAVVAPEAVMEAAIEAAGDAAVVDFEAAYDVGVTDSFAKAAAAVGAVNDKVDSVNNKIAAALGIADGVVAELNALKDAATEVIGTPGALVDSLRSLVAGATALLGLTDGIVEEYPGQASKIATDTALEAGATLGAVDVTAQPPFPGGPINPATESSTKAIGKAVRVFGLLGVAKLFVTLELESASAAAEVNATLGALTASLLADPTTSDDLAAALTDLRAALQTHLDAHTGSLPTVVSYTPEGTVPALLLAWQLYGDPTRDLEIVARNLVLDPSFVPGGVALEVLGA